MSSSPTPARAWIAEFVLLAAIWGASFLFMRLATVEFGALPTAALRVAIASLFLLPLLLWRGQSAALRRHWKPIFTVGLLNSGIPFACFAFALHYITTGLSSILNATVPLFGALVAWLWLGNRLHASRVLGLVIGFAGVTLLASDKVGLKPGMGAPYIGLLAIGACLLATLCYGLAANFTKRYLTGIPPLATATGSQVGATLGLAIPALWQWPAQPPGAVAWMALLAAGVLCTGIAYILYFRLIDAAGPSKALAVTFVVPVFALMYGVVFLGEPITLWMIGCGMIVLLGTLLSTGLLTWRRRLAAP